MALVMSAILINMSSIMLTNITTSIYNINSYILKDTTHNATLVGNFIR